MDKGWAKREACNIASTVLQDYAEAGCLEERLTRMQISDEADRQRIRIGLAEVLVELYLRGIGRARR